MWIVFLLENICREFNKHLAAAGLERGTLTYVFVITGQQPHFAHNLGAYAQVDTWIIFRVKITANKITT